MWAIPAPDPTLMELPIEIPAVDPMKIVVSPALSAIDNVVLRTALEVNAAPTVTDVAPIPIIGLSLNSP